MDRLVWRGESREGATAGSMSVLRARFLEIPPEEGRGREEKGAWGGAGAIPG